MNDADNRQSALENSQYARRVEIDLRKGVQAELDRVRNALPALFALAIARGVGIGARGEAVESYADLAREYTDKLGRA